MMVIEQQSARSEASRLGFFVDKASHLIQVVATPSLVQFVMRFALAVPFWKSGILKWTGFLQAQ